MDSFESQLRFGMTLSNLRHNENDTTFHGNRFLKNLIDRAQSELKKKSNNTLSNRSNANSITGKHEISMLISRKMNQNFFCFLENKSVNHRLEFLNYSLSLMRSSHEHGDQEPTVDVLSYKHLAYLVDAFIYYFRESGLNESSQLNKSNWKEISDEPSLNTMGDAGNNEEAVSSSHTFFQRSASTLCLSSLGPDPFQITIDDSLPLACRPQLLQPICRKEDLFGRFLYDQTAARYSHVPSQLGLSYRKDSIPDFLQPNYLNIFHSNEDKTASNKTRDDDRQLLCKQSKNFDNDFCFFVSIGMAVDVLLDLSAGLISSNRKKSVYYCLDHRLIRNEFDLLEMILYLQSHIMVPTNIC